MKVSHVIALPLLLPLLLLPNTGAEQQCEQLKTSLTYTQETAPRDLSGVLPVVVERVNRLLEGVVDVEVEWHGADLHGRVGEHNIQCKVTRLASVIDHLEESQVRDIQTDEAGREVTSQCFVVPFTILDTNECTLPRDHHMRHKCQEPALCVNTVGSYECLCPRISGHSVDTELLEMGVVDDHHDGSLDVSQEIRDAFWQTIQQQDRSPWEMSLSSSNTSCPSMASTHACCPEKGHFGEGQNCRAHFQCPVDACAPGAATIRAVGADNHTTTSHLNNCASNARCVKEEFPQMTPNFRCECSPELMGSGRTCRDGDLPPNPKVEHDGVTPTEETLKNNLYCGCTRPIVDACAGYQSCPNKHEICIVGPGNTPRCGCKPGFVMHETYGCVDKTPPILELRIDPMKDRTLRLKQGDVYKEYAVNIIDDNAEDYLRMLKISYSKPLPHSCLTTIGEFHVNYTVATPWTTPSFIRVTRRVIVEDIDECSVDVAKFERSCPSLVPKCDVEAGATCTNTVGSYRCRCPKYTSGDGFDSNTNFGADSAPEGHQGGTSCRDTSKPVIKLKGPTPKFFKICPCGGLSGVMQGKLSSLDDNLRDSQRKHYGDDIKELIQSTHGAELCASDSNPDPRPSNCVAAFDETYKGKVDLSGRVEVGDPVQKSPLHWVVPYNVKDDAGNAATTVFRDVVVEEVDLAGMEANIRQEGANSKEAEIKRAVNKALEEHRKNETRKPHHPVRAAKETCPACPKCGDSRYSLASRRAATDAAPKFDASLCDKICEERAQHCAFREDSYVIMAMLWLEGVIPPVLVPPLLGCILLFSCFVVLRFTITLLFNPNAFFQSYDYGNDERYRSMQNSVTYYQGSTPQHAQHQPVPASAPGNMNGGPPRASLSANRGEEFFLTPRGGGVAPFFSPDANGARRQESTGLDGARQQVSAGLDDIYESTSILTPRKSGEGLRQRSPYDFQRR